MKKVIVLFSFLLSATMGWGNGGNVNGVVIAVLDGNTLEIKSEDNETLKVKLHGVDSPELGQEYGKEAKEFLEKKLLRKNVTVKVQGTDRKGMPIAIVIDVRKKYDPRIELLKNGLAWTSEKNPLPELEQYRTIAEQKGVGLWKQKEPTPPWVFRRQQTMIGAKSS